MYALTLKLLQMSIQGAMLILAAALLRFALLRFLPKGTLRFLWVPAILALLIPLPALFSLSLALPEPGREVSLSADAEREAVDWDSWEALPAQGPAGILSPAEDGEASPALPLLPLVWLSGLGLFGLGFLLLYLREYARLRRARPLAGGESWLRAHPTRRRLALRVLPELSSPMTYGVLRPVILLPGRPDWDKTAQVLALEHEYVHVRHLDAAWKLLLHLVLVLHWFNPALWLMYVLLSRDLELSCDEAVLRRLGREKRADFAQMLVDTGRRSRPAPFPGLGAGSLRERVRAIMRYRQSGLPRRCLAAAPVLALCLCALCSLRVGAAGETLYRSGDLVLSVPRELRDLLIIETPALTGNTQEVLFRVLERETWEAGRELYPDSSREYGLILTVQRMDEDTAGKYLQQKTVWDLLARDERGYYYMVRRSSLEANMLTSPETADQAARWERRKLVNAWVRSLRSHLSWKEDLRTRYPAYSSAVATHLAGAMYSKGRRYRIGRGEETYELHGSTAGDDYLARLTWETATESVRVLHEPQGEPITVTQPFHQRVLCFWPGSDLVLCRSDVGAPDNVRYWYAVTLLDSPEEKVGDLAAAWFRAARETE